MSFMNFYEFVHVVFSLLVYEDGMWGLIVLFQIIDCLIRYKGINSLLSIK